MLIITNMSDTQSYSTNNYNTGKPVIIVACVIASFISIVVLITTYSVAKAKIESDGHKKPKKYFQFWAAHFFIILFFTTIGFGDNDSTITQNYFIIIFWTMGWCSISSMLILYSSPALFDLNTPIYCCCRRWIKSCHCIILLFSTSTIVFFTTYFVALLPNIIFVYYLYPTRTLLRLPLLINSVLYINTLMAILIFQCERLLFPCAKKCGQPNKYCCLNMEKASIWRLCFCVNRNENYCTKFYERLINHPELPLQQRIQNHDTYYSAYYTDAQDRKKSVLLWCTYFIHPVAVLFLLVLLIFFIKIISDLIAFHLNSNLDNPLELLLTLVPTLLLLFGSWYKLDLFYVEEEDVSKKDLLVEILQELKNTNYGRRDRGTGQGAEQDQGTQHDQGTGEHQGTEQDQHLEEQEVHVIRNRSIAEETPKLACYLDEGVNAQSPSIQTPHHHQQSTASLLPSPPPNTTKHSQGKGNPQVSELIPLLNTNS